MTTLICDFCSAPNPIMEYPCRSFGLTGEQALTPGAPVTRQGGFQWAKEKDLCFSSAPAVRSIGSWAACDACHRLIDQGQVEALTQRAFAIFRQKDPRLNQALDDLRFTFLLFYEVRTGPPIPLS
jgi:hypothetical protein